MIGWLQTLFRDSTRVTEGLQELNEIARLADAGGYGDGRVIIDPSVVRGLEYYTGPVYEAELTFTVSERARPAGALRLGRGRRAL